MSIPLLSDSSTIDSLKPEWLVLLRCAQWAAKPDAPLSPPNPDRCGIDCRELLNLAQNHGMIPLLNRYLMNARGETGTIGPLQETIRTEASAIARRNILLTGELIRIVTSLERDSISVVPFKGPLLALLTYGDATLRPFSDLDLLVQAAHVQRARELLLGLGYRTEFEAHSREDDFINSTEQVLRFIRSEISSVVELHWQFDPRNLAFPHLATQEMWLRTKKNTIAGRMFRMLSPEDTVLSLCLHGLRHCWDKLEWISCVARFVRNHESIDWDWVHSHAEAIGGRRALILSLTLIADLMGPDFIGHKWPPDMVADVLAERVWTSLLSETRERTRTVLYRYPFYFQSRDRTGDGLRMLARSGMQLFRPRKLWRRNRAPLVEKLLAPGNTPPAVTVERQESSVDHRPQFKMKTTLPLVTIGLPFVNDSGTLASAIRSIFAQTYQDWELILVDDGSLDGSRDIALSITDPRVVVLSDGVNRGLPARLNQIASLARGKYVARMDADDLMHPERIALQVRFLESHAAADIAGTGAVLIDRAGVPFAKRPPRFRSAPMAVLRSSQLVHSSIMGKTKWFQGHPYSDAYPRAEDHELWCRAWQSGAAITELKECLLFYRYEFNLARHVGSYNGDRRLLHDYGPRFLGRPMTLALRMYMDTKIAFWSVASTAGIGNRIQALRHAPLSSEERVKAQQVLSDIERVKLPGYESAFEAANHG